MISQMLSDAKYRYLMTSCDHKLQWQLINRSTCIVISKSLSNVNYGANYHPVWHTCKLVSGNQEAGSLAQHSSAMTLHKMLQFAGYFHVHQRPPSALHQHTARQDLYLQCWWGLCTCLDKRQGLAPEIPAKTTTDNVKMYSSVTTKWRRQHNTIR